MWALHEDLSTREGPLVGEVYCPFLWPHWATGYDLLKAQRSRVVVVSDEIQHQDLFPWPPRFYRSARTGDLSDIDIFHVHNGWTMATRGVELMRKYPKAKFVGQLIGTDVNVHAKGPRANSRYREFFERADAIVCISEFLEGRAIERGCPPDKIRVIPLSVDPDRLPPPKRPDEFSVDGKLVCCLVARFVPVKNIFDAIAACEIANEEALVDLHVCGNGPQKDFLVSTAMAVNEKLGRDAVTIHTPSRGLFPHEEAMRILHESDCVVSCSKRTAEGAEEGLGVSIIEGQMMGLPALCYGTGGVWEIVGQNQTGWIARFPEDVLPNERGLTNALHWDEATPAGLAQAMARLAVRRDLRVKMGRAAAFLATRFSTQSIARATDALYREIA